MNLLPYYLFKIKIKRVIAINIRTTGRTFAVVIILLRVEISYFNGSRYTVERSIKISLMEFYALLSRELGHILKVKKTQLTWLEC